MFEEYKKELQVAFGITLAKEQEIKAKA